MSSMAECAFKCSLEVAMAPVRINIMANVPLMLMLLVLLLYCALIFLMKYKTEIIRMKKKT